MTLMTFMTLMILMIFKSRSREVKLVVSPSVLATCAALGGTSSEPPSRNCDITATALWRYDLITFTTLDLRYLTIPAYDSLRSQLMTVSEG